MSGGKGHDAADRSARRRSSATRGPARLLAVDVDRDPLGDRREPRRGIAVDIETVGRLPRPHERLLHRVFGEIVTAEHAVRNA